MWLWEHVLGPPISFFNTTMAWLHSYLAILTSAWTPYKEANGTDAKAKIIAATVKEIIAKAEEAHWDLPDDLKMVYMPVFVLQFNFNWNWYLPIENTDLVP